MLPRKLHAGWQGLQIDRGRNFSDLECLYSTDSSRIEIG